MGTDAVCPVPGCGKPGVQWGYCWAHAPDGGELAWTVVEFPRQPTEWEVTIPERDENGVHCLAVRRPDGTLLRRLYDVVL